MDQDDQTTWPGRRLEQATGRLRSSGDWIDTAGLAARLRSFSFSNTLLIMDQYQTRLGNAKRPPVEPSMLATRMEWSAIGCQVRNSEIGYSVSIPRGGIVVCDVAQLTPDSRVPTWRDPVLRGGQAPAGLVGELEALIRADGYQVSDSGRDDSAGVDWESRSVLVRFDANQAEQARMLATGLSRLWLRSPAAHQLPVSPHDPQVEAVTAAMMVCAAHGMALDQHPAPTVDAWAGKPDMPGRAALVLGVGQSALNMAVAILDRLDTAQTVDGSLASLKLNRAPLLPGLPAATATPGMAVGL